MKRIVLKFHDHDEANAFAAMIKEDVEMGNCTIESETDEEVVFNLPPEESEESED